MICDVHAHYTPKNFSEFMGDRFASPIAVHAANGSLRRTSPVAECPDQGPLTEPGADARARGWGLLFLPHSRPSRQRKQPAAPG